MGRGLPAALPWGQRPGGHQKRLEPANRKKFCSRIATGDYDAVVIGHSQFEKIPLSPERQKSILQEQIDQVIDGIQEAKAQDGERYTIKQLEKSRKSWKRVWPS